MQDQRITILFLITDLPREGTQRQLFELVKGLDKARFRPIVISLHAGDAMEEAFREVPEAQLLAIERKGKFDLSCAYKVYRILRQMKVDVVQPFLTPATLYGLLPAILCRTPVKILTERNGPESRSYRPGYRLYLKIEDFLSRFTDWAIANSQAGKDYLVQRGINPSRIKVIYNGINLSRLNPDSAAIQSIKQRLNLPPGGKVVGILARLFPNKNHKLFLRAAAFISEKIPSTRFAIVGDGPLRTELEELCMNLGIASKVVFFGEQQDVGTYLSAFDIATLTSNTEGCSNSLLEAMALGRPVVTTDVGGNREVVLHGETGFLLPPGNVEELVKAITTLLENQETADSMGQKAQEFLFHRFSLENMVSQYEALYSQTLMQKARQKKGLAINGRS
jgi:glycosyltransferase involved in cell wall biosynthesis